VLLPYFLSVDNSRMPLMTLFLKIQVLASIAQDEGSITDSDLYTISNVISLEDIKNNFHCAAVDYLFIGTKERLRLSAFNSQEYVEEFDEAFYRTVINNLDHVFMQRLCLFKYMLGFGDQRRQYYFEEQIVDNKYSLKTQPDTFFHPRLAALLSWSKSYPVRLLFWNYSISLIFIIITLIYYCLRRNKIGIGLQLLLLPNFLVLFFISPARDFRYLYPVIYCMPLLILYFIYSALNDLKKGRNNSNIDSTMN